MLGVDKRKNRLLTSSIHDKVMLKLAGLRGDGTDDVLITRCWAEFLGGAGPERFTFVYKKAHRRAKRFAAGLQANPYIFETGSTTFMLGPDQNTSIPTHRES